MKFFFSIIIIIILFVPQVCAFVTFGATWPADEIPLAYYIQPSVSTSQNDTIRDGFNIWSLVETTFFEFDYRGTNSSSLGANDGINNNGFGTSLQFGYSLAVTLIWFYPDDYPGPEAGNIIDADIEFNSNMDWMSEYDLMTVAIHEAGHVLGLDHETSVECIMQPIYFGTNQFLFEDDIDGVSSIYPGRKSFVADNIYQNAPNPFVPDSDDDYTLIGYSVKADGHVKLELYNLAGELVKILVDEYKDQGEYIGSQGARWYGDNGSPNSRGRKVGSGVYIAALKTSRSKVRMKKIMLIR